MLAASLPESASQWFSVEAANDGDSTGYGSEISKIFSARGKAKKDSFVIWMADVPSNAKGVYVLVTDTNDPNFSSAQEIANMLHGVGIPVTFRTATGLTPGQVKIVVFRQ
jgi:hypothetical protein